ncbi:MAG: 50S ribosomal protein L31 [Anaerolineae bacterium]|nr:50S ribosomal protein L31 [Anaerolineae bacterium]
MKDGIHPKWFSDATVICACGNTWQTGATIPEIKTDICSACHPFYTGEQRIVDTEGQVDRFMRRLQVRDNKRAEFDAREASKTPMELPLSELGLTKRATEILAQNNIITVADFLTKLEAGEEESLLELPGVGHKTIMDIKKNLRTRGYEVPTIKAE